MTNTIEKKIKVKITKHPREIFYEGRSTRDHMNGLMQFLNTDPVIPNPKIVNKFLKTVRVGDIVGVEHNQYKVVEFINSNISGIDVKTNKQKQISLEELTMALGSGFAEILYRDGKPFGIKLQKEVKVRITDNSNRT
jgi:hypothetical protein